MRMDRYCWTVANQRLKGFNVVINANTGVLKTGVYQRNITTTWTGIELSIYPISMFSESKQLEAGLTYVTWELQSPTEARAGNLQPSSLNRRLPSNYVFNISHLSLLPLHSRIMTPHTPRQNRIRRSAIIQSTNLNCSCKYPYEQHSSVLESKNNKITTP